MTEKTVTCNDDSQQFVIPSGGGYSAFGYKNCFRDSKALAEKLNRPDLAPAPESYGTLGQYNGYRELVGLASKVDLGTWFTPGTPEQVQRILENARASGQRLRLYLGDTETGKAWDGRPEAGRIGRSMGPIKVPLLIASRRSTGGGAILTDCIVRIEETPGGRELYRHPDFTPYAVPVTSKCALSEDKRRDLVVDVLEESFSHLPYAIVQEALGVYDGGYASILESDSSGPYRGAFGNAVGGPLLETVLDAVGESVFLERQARLSPGDIAVDRLADGAGPKELAALGDLVASRVFARIAEVFPELDAAKLREFTPAIAAFATEYAVSEQAFANDALSPAI